jgi:hypothetical protein
MVYHCLTLSALSSMGALEKTGGEQEDLCTHESRLRNVFCADGHVVTLELSWL